jgi:hypothetical protein
MAAMATLAPVARGEHVPKLLRFSPELAARIEELRKQGYRPFQSQVILMLEQWLEEHAPPASTKEGKAKK